MHDPICTLSPCKLRLAVGLLRHWLRELADAQADLDEQRTVATVIALREKAKAARAFLEATEPPSAN